MLEVVSMEKATDIIRRQFGDTRTHSEHVNTIAACGRVLASDVVSPEGVPAFTRSTVDGYAVHASDTFGSSDALPAIVRLQGSVRMGQAAPGACEAGCCWAVPTGAMVPDGADAVVMVENTEDFGDGTIGVAKAAAPGENLILKEDDVACGQVVCPARTVLSPHHVGALASIGIESVDVFAAPRVAVISTGDEIVAVGDTPAIGQMRDVNGPLLAAAINAAGAQAVSFGIVKDNLESLLEAIDTAQKDCDMVVVSGGSSVGQRDVTALAFEQLGSILLHGIAMKPGKPTIVASLGGMPAFGLPGHPVAAYFVFLEFVRPLLESMQGMRGEALARPCTEAVIDQAIPSNHGRAECVAVCLRSGRGQSDSAGANGQDVTVASPIRIKSGLVGLLAQADGYVVVDRNQEGLPTGAKVAVKPF